MPGLDLGIVGWYILRSSPHMGVQDSDGRYYSRLFRIFWIERE